VNTENYPIAAVDTVISIMNCVDNLLTNQPHAGRLGMIFGTREMILGDIPCTGVYKNEFDNVFILTFECGH
jgi:hypothetical protein